MCVELSGRYEIIRKERWVDREESLERERGEEGRSMIYISLLLWKRAERVSTAEREMG